MVEYKNRIVGGADLRETKAFDRVSSICTHAKTYIQVHTSTHEHYTHRRTDAHTYIHHTYTYTYTQTHRYVAT